MPDQIFGKRAPGELYRKHAEVKPRSPKQSLQPQGMPPRSKRARHPLVVVLNFFMMVVVLGVLVVGAALYWGKMAFEREGPLQEPATVLIAKGTGLSQIAQTLEANGVIADANVFRGGVVAYKKQSRMKAGEYLFEPGDSMRDVMNKIASGRAILHTVTIPEGWTSEQIVARLRNDAVLTGTISETPEEGSLMPETYKFSRGTSRQQILNQMRSARDRAVAEAWEKRDPDLPIADVDEFVTLASIVEKETAKADERPRVASVFINRLRNNMRLQSDPTVIYGVYGGKGKPAGEPIYQSDLDKATPYNTYKINGLPPAPIANVGRSALEAVANPSKTDDLYFVADGTGGHAFATNLRDHNRNVARWRRIEAARQSEASEAVQPATQ